MKINKVHAYEFGHPITVVYTDGEPQGCKYDDTGELLEEAKDRKCPKCNMLPTKDGHDPCIANLPGVKYACCGHGKEQGYILFESGAVLRFDNLEVTENEKIINERKKI